MPQDLDRTSLTGSVCSNAPAPKTYDVPSGQILIAGINEFRVCSRVTCLAIECETISRVGDVPRITHLHTECHVKHFDTPVVSSDPESSPSPVSVWNHLSYFSTSRRSCRLSMHDQLFVRALYEPEIRSSCRNSYHQECFIVRAFHPLVVLLGVTFFLGDCPQLRSFTILNRILSISDASNGTGLV